MVGVGDLPAGLRRHRAVDGQPLAVVVEVDAGEVDGDAGELVPPAAEAVGPRGEKGEAGDVPGAIGVDAPREGEHFVVIVTQRDLEHAEVGKERHLCVSRPQPKLRLLRHAHDILGRGGTKSVTGGVEHGGTREEKEGPWPPRLRRFTRPTTSGARSSRRSSTGSFARPAPSGPSPATYGTSTTKASTGAQVAAPSCSP